MIQLATVAFFLFSTFYGPASGIAPQEEARAGVPPVNAEVILAAGPRTLEEYVREYFHDEPLLAEIAKCETRFTHFGEDGSVIRGELSEEDVGVMQINEFYHAERAKKLGFDLHTVDGNLAYAKWLYAKEGAAPWFSSARCWRKADTLAKADSHSGLLLTD